ncbi:MULTISPECIES: GNAT family N-acetyltransferase [unclassified Pseudomonas]|uniref:GNAT family N-acetyltransferase n=1 Tax=unclassified Pseudomonas TaxID=196821 RepID=UPI0025FCEC86|nr:MULTISPECIES: GNAT family N-acetyltransferase [unclassified Pseudomonas]
MKITLIKYQALSALQGQQVLQIGLPDTQKKMVGDIHGGLHVLSARPSSDIQGCVLLVDEVPRGFFVLKRRSLLPPWAQGRTATLHALMIDQHYQGLGLGKACLHRLPQWVSELWPEIEQLKLAVHPANQTALGLYQALGWTLIDHPATPAEGSELQMLLRLR